MTPCAVHIMFIKVLVYTVINLVYGEASDTMVPSQAITVGRTLMSANQKFELGFFSPDNSSTTRYMGIWFKDIPRPILWVANRERPLSASDESASLVLTKNGNLRILDGKQHTVWHTNVTVELNDPIVVLSDTGDLILKDNRSGWVAWESFEHPFANVHWRSDQSMPERQFLISWKSEVDPGVGHFTAGLLPQSPLQGFVWNGSDIHYRSGPWNGLTFVGSEETPLSYSNLDGWSFRQNKETGTISFSPNITTIMKLFPQGSLKVLDWVGNEWKVRWEKPGNQCDLYGKCGPFGVCNTNESPICKCPRGFTPASVEEWGKGNWTHGCARRLELPCSKNMTAKWPLAKGKYDGFWKLSRMKVPDNYRYLPSGKDTQGCQEECLSNCSCTAYSYVNGIGCLVWMGELTDMLEFSMSGEDLFIRLDHSELATSKKVKVIISLTSALFFIILCFLIKFAMPYFRNKKRKRAKGISNQLFLQSCADAQQLLNWKTILQNELTTYDLEDIMTATNSFCVSNKVGEGGFGSVFRGKLHDGQEIAVKRLSGHSGQGINELINEILLISKLQHRNLVKVLGCSIEGDEKLIVYEYLPNGSLDTFLFDSSKKTKLDWATRFNIIQGIARGISYLHQDSRLKVIHRDLKASNVLLDNDMNPKISDFGLARAFQGTQDSADTHRIVGTYGYMSPEYGLRGIFSEKSDVFSFGVLLLEIISGKKICSFESSDEALTLLSHAWKLWNEGRELELIDESLVDARSDQVVRCIRVGVVCVQDRADDRPTMPTVILMLSSDMLIPQPKQPLFVPESPSLKGCHPLEEDKIWSANEVTESLVQGR